MKVLVTFALDAEFAPWRSLRTFRPGQWGSVPALCTEIAGAEVGVVVTGIGSENAASTACAVMWRQDINLCISAGLAAALRPEHLPAEILAARTVNSEGPWGPRQRQIVGSDEALLLLAKRSGAKIVGGFLTVSHVLLTGQEKRSLGAVADAAEMESFEILEEASACGIRALAVRAISDAVHEDLPMDFNRVLTKEGEVSFSRVLGEVLRSPQSLRALVRFGQQSRHASEALAKFLDRYVEALVEQWDIAEIEVPVAAT